MSRISSVSWTKRPTLPNARAAAALRDGGGGPSLALRARIIQRGSRLSIDPTLSAASRLCADEDRELAARLVARRVRGDAAHHGRAAREEAARGRLAQDRDRAAHG